MSNESFLFGIAEETEEEVTAETEEGVTQEIKEGMKDLTEIEGEVTLVGR